VITEKGSQGDKGKDALLLEEAGRGTMPARPERKR